MRTSKWEGIRERGERWFKLGGGRGRRIKRCAKVNGKERGRGEGGMSWEVGGGQEHTDTDTNTYTYTHTPRNSVTPLARSSRHTSRHSKNTTFFVTSLGKNENCHVTGRYVTHHI